MIYTLIKIEQYLAIIKYTNAALNSYIYPIRLLPELYRYQHAIKFALYFIISIAFMVSTSHTVADTGHTVADTSHTVTNTDAVTNTAAAADTASYIFGNSIKPIYIV